MLQYLFFSHMCNAYFHEGNLLFFLLLLLLLYGKPDLNKSYIIYNSSFFNLIINMYYWGDKKIQN